MIVLAQPELIEGSVVVSPKALENVPDKFLAPVRAVGELVTVEMIEAGRNENVLEDIERCAQPLDEVVGQIIIGVGTVVEKRAERALPLLGLQQTVSIRLIVKKTFKV